MTYWFSLILPHRIPVILVIFSTLNSCFSLRFPSLGQGYGSGYTNTREEQNNYINTALSKLEHAPQLEAGWPDPAVRLGQVSGVAVDLEGRLLVFHRGSHVWDASSFNGRDVYQGIGEPAIPYATVLAFNDTGKLVDMWGQNLFFMPHGITVDKDGNVWLTDVALHQVFKFTPHQREKPALVLGEKFVPGSDDEHFCKPSAVAVLASGDFFVADGYCNTRVVKFAADGTKILQWGRATGNTPFTFKVVHALTLAEDRGLVCVADRERGRAPCFRADNGTFVQAYSSWLIGPRLFSVAYAPVHGGRLYVVNGPDAGVPVRGYVIDFDSGRLVQTFAPAGGFRNPHDVVASPDGSKVYVAELSPYRVYKFADAALANETADQRTATPAPAPAKPTATLESASVGRVGRAQSAQAWEAWRGAAGGAGGALAAALLAGAALALLRARNRGRKGAPRRRWEYGGGEFKLRRLLDRRRFTRVRAEDSDDEPAPMLPTPAPATA